jgi:hypothetical protein
MEIPALNGVQLGGYAETSFRSDRLIHLLFLFLFVVVFLVLGFFLFFLGIVGH